jgi:hypothetical protein
MQVCSSEGQQLSPAVNKMNHKLAECPRTWHSLWDEMFAALAASAFDTDSDNTDRGFGPDTGATDTWGTDIQGTGNQHPDMTWSDAPMAVESWLLAHAPQQSNDNSSA